jgi:processive 1,2-diacylglycerol beta-glucosyltransferase
MVADWAATHPGMTVGHLSYLEDMKPLLQSASALVCRSGTGLTSEAILCQCPIIFNGVGGIMPQENITLQYCRRNRLGLLFRKAVDLPAVVSRILRDPSHLVLARQRKQQIRPTRTPQDLIRRMEALLDN